MNRVPLFDEYRLIERSENEINGAWKGAHLLLFFLAFVFGSFCTFCFHMLMYLFDEKCVLFPKLLSLTSLRHNIIYEFMPSNKDLTDMPVDFLSTQWVEKSTCSLPTYVPLVSGIFGLVWITMFLMCSTGSRTLTGLQRPWRVLPPVFLFSLAMGGLCIYSSTVTHSGLQELCLKLGEITGSSTCTYTVNVATLTYERRIRGVYQATRLTILSAWLHTSCWLLSALLALVRVLMAVDFQLVRVNVELHGDIDKILEKHEIQIRTVSPEVWINDENEADSDTKLPTKSRTPKKAGPEEMDEVTGLINMDSDVLFFSKQNYQFSELSLIPEERDRVARVTAYKTVPRDKQFIVKWLYDLVDTMHIPEFVSDLESSTTSSTPTSISTELESDLIITRQYGQAKIASGERHSKQSNESQKIVSLPVEAEGEVELLTDDSAISKKRKVKKIKEAFDLRGGTSALPSTSQEPHRVGSVITFTPETKIDLESETTDEDLTPDEKPDQNKKTRKGKKRKSNLKTIGVQTEKKSGKAMHVQISEKSFYIHESEEDADTSPEKKDDVDKETQTREKEKQD